MNHALIFSSIAVNTRWIGGVNFLEKLIFGETVIYTKLLVG
ncbi:hypothetical protein V8V91_26385 [Algoriphagus halophilus]